MDAVFARQAAGAGLGRDDRQPGRHVVQHLDIRAGALLHRVEAQIGALVKLDELFGVDETEQADVGGQFVAVLFAPGRSDAADDADGQFGQLRGELPDEEFGGVHIRPVVAADEDRERAVGDAEAAAQDMAARGLDRGDRIAIDAVGDVEQFFGGRAVAPLKLLGVGVAARQDKARPRDRLAFDLFDAPRQVAPGKRPLEQRFLHGRFAIVRVVDQRRTVGRQPGGHPGMGDDQQVGALEVLVQQPLITGRVAAQQQRDGDVDGGIAAGQPAPDLMHFEVADRQRHDDLAEVGGEPLIAEDRSRMIVGAEVGGDEVGGEMAIELPDADAAAPLGRVDDLIVGDEQVDFFVAGAGRFAVGMNGDLAAGARLARLLDGIEQAVDKALPGDVAHAFDAVAAHLLQFAEMGRHPVEPFGHGGGIRLDDKAGFAVLDDLGRLARIGGGQHGLARQERFEGDHAEVFIDRGKDVADRAGIKLAQAVFVDMAKEADPAVAGGQFTQPALIGATADNQQGDIAPARAHRLDDQVEPFPGMQAADGEEVLALARRIRDERRGMMDGSGGDPAPAAQAARDRLADAKDVRDPFGRHRPVVHPLDQPAHLGVVGVALLVEVVEDPQAVAQVKHLDGVAHHVGRGLVADHRIVGAQVHGVEIVVAAQDAVGRPFVDGVGDQVGGVALAQGLGKPLQQAIHAAIDARHGRGTDQRKLHVLAAPPSSSRESTGAGSP
ncbi:MAG: hypothetical protein BWZ08_01774 [candidate division BRC1 bacterium ADurb.BinA292]|nr:MAG: hypothetical protein BWZ08_01774 [candidate division BRC1 bacterium ADurb.BinA292]